MRGAAPPGGCPGDRHGEIQPGRPFRGAGGTAMTADPEELVPALRRALGRQWQFHMRGEQLAIRHQAAGSPYRPARTAPAWPEMLARIEGAFAGHGIARAHPLPIRWNHETDFTISAIQALDPYLKRRQEFTYRQGYLPQPVIRFTGHRDEAGNLADGFLTAFVNISCIQPIAGIDEHAAILDAWLTVLSRLGLHARHIQILGRITSWRRREVRGVTLHIRHADLPIGDLVLLWNAEDPSVMVTDLGSGLERLRWAVTRAPWQQIVHGPLAGHASLDVLDAIRTGTLITGSGIRPAARGCGGALRKLSRTIPASDARLGLSTAVRHACEYWSLTATMNLPWPHICQILEHEVLSAPRTSR